MNFVYENCITIHSILTTNKNSTTPMYYLQRENVTITCCKYSEGLCIHKQNQGPYGVWSASEICLALSPTENQTYVPLAFIMDSSALWR